MDVFDIIGPVMVGPSSSHTAGAARIALVARRIAGDRIKHAKIIMHGSFADTYRGHGTDKAVLGGLLGFTPDDARIRESKRLAAEDGLEYTVETADLGDVHPNTVRIETETVSGRKTSVTGSSIGGGRIRIIRLNGIDVDFNCEYNTLIVEHKDRPGVVARVTAVLGTVGINIAAMRVFRAERGGTAVMVIETDQKPEPGVIAEIKKLRDVLEVQHVFL